MGNKKIDKIFRRLSKAYQWQKKEENLHLPKLLLKWLVALALPLGGVVGKAAFDAYKKAHPNEESFAAFLRENIPWLAGRAGEIDLLLFGATLALVVLAVAIAFLIYRIARVAWGSTKPAPVAENTYARPTENAKLLVSKLSESPDDYKIVGGAIEIARHPSILCDPTISGWDCMPIGAGAEIQIVFDHALPFQVDEQLIQGVPMPGGANNPKYSLVETPLDFTDAASRLSLKVRSTDYYTVKRYAAMIHGEGNTETRHRIGSIFPELQRAPSSLCLHFLVQLADGNILCMLRRGYSDYSRGQLSISAEEQLAEEDVLAGPDRAMSHWFKRALCEEIFPLRSLKVDEGWKLIERDVAAMRVFSVFYEEEYANYSLFGFVRLALDTDEYKQKCERLSAEPLGGRDKEGRSYLLSKEQAINYALTGRGEAMPLWGEQKPLAFSEENGAPFRPHLSSRYRLLTFLLSMSAIDGRRPNGTVEDDLRNKVRLLTSELEAERRQLRKLRDELNSVSAD